MSQISSQSPDGNNPSQPTLGDANSKKDILPAIQQALSRHAMLCHDDGIVVGLSGGADSIMLIHYLKFALKRTVYACHINHMLRGDESEHDMQFVQKFCSDFSIPLWVEKIDVAEYSQKNRLSIEEAGREVRYTAFETTREHFGAQKIATAHTLSDNAETLLLNLSRGCGLNGLCGIPPVRGIIIRPLIYITRKDVEQYCTDHSLAYVTDSTNLESIYTRNKIRLEVLPKLSEVNPQIYNSINKTITTIINENDYISSIAVTQLEYTRRGEGLSTSQLAELHTAIRHRVIGLFLYENDIPKTNDLIFRIDRLILCDNGKINVKTNLFIEVKKHTLIISDNNKILDYFEHPLEVGEFINDDGICYEIKLCDLSEIETMKKIYKKLLYVALDYDKIVGKANIRQRKSGDKITLTNRGGTKTVKKLFIDDKLTAVEKSQILVVSDDDGVIALMGYGEDARVAVDNTTKCCLVILKKTE